MTASRPSLPQRAGRVLAKLYAKLALLGIERVRAKNRPVVKANAKPRKRSERVLTVRAAARPEVDVAKLARALLHAAEDIACSAR